jgi:hypothetical protein
MVSRLRLSCKLIQANRWWSASRGYLAGSVCATALANVSYPQRLRRMRCRRLTISQREEIRNSLDSLLAEELAQPVSITAARLGIIARCLRYWFPEQCAALTIRAHEAQLDRSIRHQASQCRRGKMAVHALRLAGRYPSRRQVNAILRKDGMSLAQQHLAQAYHEAVAP